MKLLHNNPKLTLVGAGPGAADLLTIRGANALQDADVVLYDALVDREVLEFASHAEHIFVGKRRGYKRLEQEEINALIVEKALSQGHVVRLKGGDPFVFGRGGEEMAHIASFGIDIDVVPGVSSATSVPQELGVSLTHRGISESFWVITGTTANRTLSNDVHLAAQSRATVVILMGMSKLPEIVTSFQAEGKGQIPVAIIQNGFRKNRRIGIGTIDSIVSVVDREGLDNPAIIVIGEVIKHSLKLKGIYEEVHQHYIKKEAL
ncbi:MAG: uroporphyrinogen-III C-methyltransferase [Fluviicola sp. XM-24bin1]|nr:MAG: uroporphyrinogen-III C-methyltransferase [Fluviicola sp. XM-24bin1]